MKTQQEILEHIRLLRTAQTSLAHYSNLVLGVVPALHHKLICEAIDQLINDEYDELVINTPPGSAKSTYTSHALGAYYLGRFPHNNVILATHTAELSERWSRKVRNTVASPPHLKLFPESGLSRDSTAVSRWATTQGGELLAAGVGGSILGFRADLGIIDDPISGYEQAQSLTQLQKIHSWYETDFVTRLKPGAKVVLICQRLSPNDLAGYLLQRNTLVETRRQRALVLQMECTSPNDPCGRPIGARLWPEWYTEAMVEDAKRDEFKWKTLYQQEPPSDTGSWVSTDEIGFRPSPVAPDMVYGMTDLALSVNRGDYTVHMLVAVDTNGDWDILEADRQRVDPEASSNNIVNHCATYLPREWLIDDDNASKVFMNLVATKGRARGVVVPWKPMPIRGADKEVRAAPLRGQFKRHKVFLPPDKPWTKWFVTEVLSFPNAMGQGVDDGIDALGLLGRRLMAVATPSAKVIPLPVPTMTEMRLDELWETAPGFNRRRI